MSWFKQKISGSIRQEKFSSSSLSPSAVRSGSGSVAEQTRNEHGHEGRVSVNPAEANHVVDLDATESHWNSASSILLRNSSTWQDDDWNVVLRFCDEVLSALEADDHTTYLRLTNFLLSSEVLEKLVSCLAPPAKSTTSRGRSDRLRSSLLRLFDLLLSQSSEVSLLTERRLTKPLLRLLAICGGTSGEPVESYLVAVLHQLCVGITQFPAVLDLLFGGDAPGMVEAENGAADGEKTPSQFLVFSLLVPFVHREGHAAQQARDDLLLIMSLSSALSSISHHIVDNSDFCPVRHNKCINIIIIIIIIIVIVIVIYLPRAQE